MTVHAEWKDCVSFAFSGQKKCNIEKSFSSSFSPFHAKCWYGILLCPLAMCPWGTCHQKGRMRALMWSVLTGKGYTSLHHQTCVGGRFWGLAAAVRGDHLVFWWAGIFHLHKYTSGMERSEPLSSPYFFNVVFCFVSVTCWNTYEKTMLYCLPRKYGNITAKTKVFCWTFQLFSWCIHCVIWILQLSPIFCHTLSDQQPKPKEPLLLPLLIQWDYYYFP